MTIWFDGGWGEVGEGGGRGGGGGGGGGSDHLCDIGDCPYYAENLLK